MRKQDWAAQGPSQGVVSGEAWPPRPEPQGGRGHDLPHRVAPHIRPFSVSGRVAAGGGLRLWVKWIGLGQGQLSRMVAVYAACG